VAFKVVGIDGLSREIAGEIIAADEKVITGFKSTNKGMGYFLLKPEPIKQYYASFWHNNQKYIVPLPHVAKHGSAMSLILSGHSHDAILSIKQTQPSTLTQKYVTGSAYGKVWFSADVNSFKDSCRLKIPLEMPTFRDPPSGQLYRDKKLSFIYRDWQKTQHLDTDTNSPNRRVYIGHEILP